jgi:hypothetical protein
MWCKLAEDTLALRVSSAPTTSPDVPFGTMGLWFTRKPRLLIIGKGISRVEARRLCEHPQLTTEQLTSLRPGARCSASTRDPAGPPGPAPTPAESAGRPPSTNGKNRKGKKK